MFLKCNYQHVHFQVFVGFLWLFLTALSSDLSLLLLAMGFSFLIAVFQFNLKFAFQLFILNMFLIVFLVFVLISQQGEILFQFLGFDICSKSLMTVQIIFLRANAIFLILFSIIRPLSLNQVAAALVDLGISKKFIYLILFSARYVQYFKDEFYRLRVAIQVRGFIPRTSFHCYKTYGQLIAIVFLRGVFRSEKIYQAMLCRGFCGEFYFLPLSEQGVFTSSKIAILIILFFLYLGAFLWINIH